MTSVSVLVLYIGFMPVLITQFLIFSQLAHQLLYSNIYKQAERLKSRERRAKVDRLDG